MEIMNHSSFVNLASVNAINTIKTVYFMQFYHRCLPREVDPLVYNMTHEDPGDVKYSDVGGLGEQIRELREVRVLQILNTKESNNVQYLPLTAHRNRFISS